MTTTAHQIRFQFSFPRHFRSTLENIYLTNSETIIISLLSHNNTLLLVTPWHICPHILIWLPLGTPLGQYWL